MYRSYTQNAAWKFGTRDEYLARRGKDWVAEQTWWMFEPHVAEAVFQELVQEAKVSVVFGERLNLENGVVKEGSRIARIVMESGRTFAGRVFIDASYEGDLMAKAGVSYAIGRESNSLYGEKLNGVQPNRQHERFYHYHQFMAPVDAYIRRGDLASGLLPSVGADGPGAEGAGDHRIQAYCFRTCLTDQPDNQVPITRPKGYEPLRYELLLRYYEAGFDGIPIDPLRSLARFGPKGPQPGLHSLPSRKTDNNNVHAVSLDNTGMNYGYPEGDYVERAKIVEDHRLYQQGLYWTLANDPRVPTPIRREMARWGLAKDEFTDNDHWPHQIYVREARRMITDLVMTEHHCLGQETVPDSVGLASYGMDSHNVQRYVDEYGRVRNEGNVQTEGNLACRPYPISYRSIVPRASECTNLLVPVCLSASHVAYGSIRMEPAYMVLGQSAGVAAVEAIEQGTAVQEIDYPRLRARLIALKQTLADPE